jgi:hypothetical protein
MLNKDQLLIWLKDTSPALIVFFGSILFFFLTGKLTSVYFQDVLIKSIIRLVRFTIFLCLPIFLIFPVYNFIIERTKGVFLQIECQEKLQIHPLTHWLARPFQGIGIILLFSTKLLISLSIIVGVPESALFRSTGHFQMGRFLTVSIITVLIAILLSNLWTFDDMGIRYFNRKDQEIKMIGKYIGTIMPIIFGFYGIFTLHANYPVKEAFFYLFKLIIILYPPFLIFAVIHNYATKNKSEFLAAIPGLEKRRLD